MLHLVRVTDELPEGFAALRAEAEAEGHRHLTRLEDEWRSRLVRFDRSGETLLAAFRDGELLGVGGMTREPSEPSVALRMRRLYVALAARGSGVGRAIVNALLQEALGAGERVTVNSDARAGGFWEAIGFQAAADRPWSHEYAG